MLLGEREKTVKLYAENFLWGNITFDHGRFEEERQLLTKASNDFGHALDQWAIADADGDHHTDFYKKATENLYHMILRLRAKGRITGILHDVDLEQENIRLKDNNVRLQLLNEDLKKDNIRVLKELKDKDELIEQYERTQGVRKP